MSSRELAGMAGVFLLLIIFRIPALTGPVNLSQDAIEYIDIARNVAQGEGLTLRIRAYFLGDGYKLPYPSESLRSPLFPALMGEAFALLPSARVFQWFNFCLFLANLALLALILRRVMPFPLTAYALVLAGLAEPMFLTSIFPWAEQTAFFWLLLGTLLVSVELHHRWGSAGAAVEGMVAALASLSRPEYILVAALLFAWLVLRRERRGLLAAFLLGCLAPLAAVALINLRVHGRLFLPGEYLFRRRQYASYFSWENVGGGEGAVEFVTANWFWICQRILRNAVNYLAKLVGWKDLFALAVALPWVLCRAGRGAEGWRRQHLALIPAAFFCAYCLVWAGIDRERYLLPMTSFWLPLCVAEVYRWRKQARSRWARIACLGILVANPPLFLGYAVSADLKMQRRTTVAERFYARDNAAWLNPDLSELESWIDQNVGRDQVLCLENPFLVNFQTRRLTLLLPEQIRPEEFSAFLSYYGVSYWVNNTVFTKYQPGRLAELEKKIRETGAREAARCGTYHVWRVKTAPN